MLLWLRSEFERTALASSVVTTWYWRIGKATNIRCRPNRSRCAVVGLLRIGLFAMADIMRLPSRLQKGLLGNELMSLQLARATIETSSPVARCQKEANLPRGPWQCAYPPVTRPPVPVIQKEPAPAQMLCRFVEDEFARPISIRRIR